MSRRPRVPLTRTLYLLPAIDDSLDERTKNAIAARNACATEGRCPSCGAEGERHATGFEGVYRYVFRHEDDCDVFTGGEAA
jgi:hypothetical protein